jgi:hypothetical protein
MLVGFRRRGGFCRRGRGRLRLARLGDERRFRDRHIAARPVLILFAHRGGGGSDIPGRLHIVMRRNAQNRAALQRVDIVFVERVGIGLQQRQHHRVGIGVFVLRRPRNFG